jgi:hypothetical protein
VLKLRRELREHSDLGEFGAYAIRNELIARKVKEIPSERTIYRILDRRGALEGNRRVRRKPPPPGWYLPDVADGRAELDQFDTIEGLVIKGGPQIEVLTTISLHGGLSGAWPSAGITSKTAVEAILKHWGEGGLPDYAQFDNDMVFHGSYHYPDAIGSVMRMCLSLGVVPVFVPPREMGFQAAMESFNGRWQAKVWARFHHDSLKALRAQSARYVKAHRLRSVSRREAAPERKTFPKRWKLRLQDKPHGKIVFLRRTTAKGQVGLLGSTFDVDSNWLHRLVRCEVELDERVIRFYGLRRRAPDQQPLLKEVPYTLPNRRSRE